MTVTIHGYLDIKICEAETKTPQQLCCVVGQGDVNYFATCVSEKGCVCVWGEIATFIVTCLEDPCQLQLQRVDFLGNTTLLGTSSIPWDLLLSENLLELRLPVKRKSGVLSRHTFVSLKIQFCRSSSSGFLSKYGSPISQIPQRVKTGDIVLFDTNRMISKFTSALMASRWDHIAMVLCVNQDILLLEAVMERGVTLNPIGRVGNILHRGGAIGFRHLEEEEEEEEEEGGGEKRGEGEWRREGYEKLREYLVKVLGRAYEVEVGKYLRAGLGKSKEGGGGEGRMFCSQLVAGAYIAMGLLPPNKLPADYLPRDFSKNLSTTPPSFLGPLLIHSPSHSFILPSSPPFRSSPPPSLRLPPGFHSLPLAKERDRDGSQTVRERRGEKERGEGLLDWEEKEVMFRRRGKGSETAILVERRKGKERREGEKGKVMGLSFGEGEEREEKGKGEKEHKKKGRGSLVSSFGGRDGREEKGKAMGLSFDDNEGKERRKSLGSSFSGSNESEEKGKAMGLPFGDNEEREGKEKRKSLGSSFSGSNGMEEKGKVMGLPFGDNEERERKEKRKSLGSSFSGSNESEEKGKVMGLPFGDGEERGKARRELSFSGGNEKEEKGKAKGLPFGSEGEEKEKGKGMGIFQSPPAMMGRGASEGRVEKKKKKKRASFLTPRSPRFVSHFRPHSPPPPSSSASSRSSPTSDSFLSLDSNSPGNLSMPPLRSSSPPISPPGSPHSPSPHTPPKTPRSPFRRSKHKRHSSYDAAPSYSPPPRSNFSPSAPTRKENRKENTKNTHSSKKKKRDKRKLRAKSNMVTTSSPRTILTPTTPPPTAITLPTTTILTPTTPPTTTITPPISSITPPTTIITPPTTTITPPPTTITPPPTTITPPISSITPPISTVTPPLSPLTPKTDINDNNNPKNNWEMHQAAISGATLGGCLSPRVRLRQQLYRQSTMRLIQPLPKSQQQQQQQQQQQRQQQRKQHEEHHQQQQQQLQQHLQQQEHNHQQEKLAALTRGQVSGAVGLVFDSQKREKKPATGGEKGGKILEQREKGGEPRVGEGERGGLGAFLDSDPNSLDIFGFLPPPGIAIPPNKELLVGKGSDDEEERGKGYFDPFVCP